jgi:hypothetical protein
MPTKSRVLLSVLVVALLSATVSVGIAIAKENSPRGKWMPNNHGPGTPSPFPCTGDNGVPGHEYFWDADRDGEHDHKPGSFESAPSEPVGCFTDEQLKGNDKNEG